MYTWLFPPLMKGERGFDFFGDGRQIVDVALSLSWYLTNRFVRRPDCGPRVV